MRIPLLPPAVIVGFMLTTSAAANPTPGPPPAAPVFYCPKAMASPPACPAMGHAIHHHARWHARRLVSMERRSNLDDRGVSASQAWVYGYELGRGGLPLRNGVRRDYAVRRAGTEHDWAREPHRDRLSRPEDEGRRGLENREFEQHSHGDGRQAWQDGGGHAMNRDGAHGFAYQRSEEVRSGGRPWGEGSPRNGDFDGRETAGQHWRYGQGGGYEVYRTAGRDGDGYLVWAGKARR